MIIRYFANKDILTFNNLMDFVATLKNENF